MPKLVDTTVRLLAQEPLAGRLPTAELLRLAEILDGAGFACLEVSGGGGEAEALVAQARKLPDLGATRVIVNDPTGSLAPHLVQGLIARISEASGLPVGLYCQGATGTGLAAALAATQAGADLVACA